MIKVHFELRLKVHDEFGDQLLQIIMLTLVRIVFFMSTSN